MDRPADARATSARSDRERLLETMLAPVEVDEEDRAARRSSCWRAQSPEEIAAALVRAHRAPTAGARGHARRQARARERGERRTAPGLRGVVWFRMDIGRRHNADPRWLLPLICRRGHITRNEIGAIRIAANESYFEVTERATPGFIKALRRATIAPEDDGMVIEMAPPRDAAAAAQARR